MQSIHSQPVQFGKFWGNSPQKRLQKKADALLDKQTEEAETQKAKAFKDSCENIQKALGKKLFSDEQGDFQGWHLLELIQKSKDETTEYDGTFFYIRSLLKGTASKHKLKDNFRLLGIDKEYESLLGEMKDLELVEYSDYSSYITISERGKKVLKLFKKDVSKTRPFSGKRGTYTF